MKLGKWANERVSVCLLSVIDLFIEDSVELVEPLHSVCVPQPEVDFFGRTVAPKPKRTQLPSDTGTVRAPPVTLVKLCLPKPSESTGLFGGENASGSMRSKYTGGEEPCVLCNISQSELLRPVAGRRSGLSP